MVNFLVFFFISLVGLAFVFWIFFRLSGGGSTSMPFGLIFVALTSAVLSIQLSPWATPAVLALYAGFSLKEYLEDKRHLTDQEDINPGD